MVMDANEFETKEILKLTEIKKSTCNIYEALESKTKEMYRSFVSQASKLLFWIIRFHSLTEEP